MADISARRQWYEVYRLARMTPCRGGANTSWTRAYPYPMNTLAVEAAWTGKFGDVLSGGTRLRSFLYLSRSIPAAFILHGSAHFQKRKQLESS